MKILKNCYQKICHLFQSKGGFQTLHKEHSQSIQNKKRKTRRVSISTNWGESESTSIQILKSAEKKQKLSEENNTQA
jgi:hypothetical protein